MSTSLTLGFQNKLIKGSYKESDRVFLYQSLKQFSQ